MRDIWLMYVRAVTSLSKHVRNRLIQTTPMRGQHAEVSLHIH